jgi:hypothetical protein
MIILGKVRPLSGRLAEAHPQVSIIAPNFAPTADVAFHRLAVTPQQVEEYGLLTRPTKKSNHSKNFAGDSVEVDAVPTPILRQLVRDAIEEWIDDDALALTRAAEADERQWLNNLSMGAA